MIHPYWDMALLAMDGLPAGKPLKLALADARDLEGRRHIRHRLSGLRPAQSGLDVQNDVFERALRRQTPAAGPVAGRLRHVELRQDGARRRPTTARPWAATRARPCSTWRRARCSRLISAGASMSATMRCPPLALSRDGRVIAAGVAFAGKPPGGQTRNGRAGGCAPTRVEAADGGGGFIQGQCAWSGGDCGFNCNALDPGRRRDRR